jgi:hypothetical protein
MSQAVAIPLVAGLILALIAPLGLASRKAIAAVAVAATYGIAIALLVAYHSGLFSTYEFPAPIVQEIAKPDVTDPQCDKLFSLLDQAHVIIDRTRPPHLVVVQKTWSEFPEVVHQAVVECVQRSWPSDSEPVEVEQRAQ